MMTNSNEQVMGSEQVYQWGTLNYLFSTVHLPWYPNHDDNLELPISICAQLFSRNCFLSSPYTKE